MKNLLLYILFILPVWLMGQDVKNGTFSIDFGKKKQKSDSTQQQPPEEQEDTIAVKHRRVRKPADDSLPNPFRNSPVYDYKKDGIFSALFHAGFNAAQIDGDLEYGYKYFGAEGGIGVLARFHKIISMSLSIDYTMLGARARLNSSAVMLEKYAVQLDYLQVPVAINAHYKQLLMVSIGVAPGYLMRYKELDYDGINITNQPNPLGEPLKFGMVGFGGFDFIIKQHYALGWKFSYSIIKIRGSEPYTRVDGERNNYMTFDFMYILHGVKKKK